MHAILSPDPACGGSLKVIVMLIVVIVAVAFIIYLFWTRHRRKSWERIFNKASRDMPPKKRLDKKQIALWREQHGKRGKGWM